MSPLSSSELVGLDRTSNAPPATDLLPLDTVAKTAVPAKGAGTILFPGGSSVSTTLVVSHNLGTVPTSVVATVTGGTVTFPNQFPLLEVTLFTSTTFSITAVTLDLSAPAANKTATFCWIAV